MWYFRTSMVEIVLLTPWFGLWLTQGAKYPTKYALCYGFAFGWKVLQAEKRFCEFAHLWEDFEFVSVR